MKSILFIVSITIMTAQIEPRWTNSIGGSSSDEGYSIQQTTDGGFIITGYTLSFGNGNRDVWLIKTDPEGNVEWDKTFGGTDYDVGNSVQKTIDGGFIIIGGTVSFGYNGGLSAWLIKTDSEGNEEWNTVFNEDAGQGYSVQQTADNGFIFTGYKWDGNRELSLIKTNSDGIEEWNRTFGGLGQDWGYSVKQTTDNGYIITGYTESYWNGIKDVYLIKTDQDGIEEWSQTYEGTNNDAGYSVQQTTNGGFIITGYTSTVGNGERDVWLIKTDSEGNIEWNNTFGENCDDWGFSVQQTTDNGFIVTGHKGCLGGTDVWLIKTDQGGIEEWNQTFGGAYDDEGYSVQQTTDGGFIVTGSTLSFGNGGKDVWLIKVKVNGCTDILAINYEPNALEDDGTCYYIEDIDQHFVQNWEGIPLNPMGIYVNSAILDEINLRVGDEIGIFDAGECIGMVQLTDEITSPIQIFLSQDNPDTPEIDGFEVGENIIYKFWDASEQIEVINVNSILSNGDEVFTPLGFSEVQLSVNSILGCTDFDSINYTPEATVDDGSCVPIVYGCTDPESCNYTPEANLDDNCFYFDCAQICDGSSYLDDCYVCDDDPENDNECYGCMDIWALNFNPEFTLDDGSCDYPNIGDISMDGIINVSDIVLLVGVVLDGEYFIEYMDINQDSYLNIIDIVILVDIIFHPEYLGCTDPEANNYVPIAIYDNGNCEFDILGCTDITAINFDLSANQDNTTCEYYDIDGNLFHSVVIGNQRWMLENLKVIHYSNGDEIPTGSSLPDWHNSSSGAYLVYNNYEPNIDVYGLLYNWFAASDPRDIAPEGWHVPNDSEWSQLVGFLGDNAGGKLKEVGNTHWLDPNIGATNESGFTGLGSGYYSAEFHGYEYTQLHRWTYFWTSSQYGNNNYNITWFWGLHYGYSDITHELHNTRRGLSIRCVRNAE
jgi:uncharacterized protein (TIGR02145 family)